MLRGSQRAGKELLQLKDALMLKDDGTVNWHEAIERLIQSQVDTAQEAGVAVSTMKARIQRGRQKLRQALLHCCHVELDCRHGIAAFSPKRAASSGSGAAVMSNHPLSCPVCRHRRLGVARFCQ
jgi:hypothetical protein